ncbi:MAG: gamma-glutamyl-gamma-aminobutyrate hydrolase family protein [Planctomycetes bacterium]|nr:gamma-glutamyl-gamma-aminobutyrate hydrolase family protein [Planctomycetota bacterium]
MSRVEHPLIAINGEMEPGKTAPRLSLNNLYADAVLRAGGVPIAIPPVGGPRDIARLLANVDGIVLGGGEDLDLARLGRGANHAQVNLVLPAKQDFDVALARAALERGLPVLGVCFGMQLLAVVEGGAMHQHLPDDRPGSREHRGNVVHPVEVVAGTKLASLLELVSLDVVSSHHQAVASLGPDWRVSARDDQGLIEAIERPDHFFCVGVQWHPERSPEGGPNDRLFRALVGAAGVARARELHSPAAAQAR